MAAFLARAFELGPAATAGFGDTAESVHRADIDSLFAAGITRGCSSDPLLFCPQRHTTKAQMATFLRRALEAPSRLTTATASSVRGSPKPRSGSS